MNFSFVLERKKQLRSLVLQAPAGLFPDTCPRRWIAYLFAFYSDPHTPVASPLPPQAPPQERRGSDPRGLAPPGPAEGPQSSGPLLAGKQTSTDIPVYLILVGQGGVERRPPPFFPHPLQPETRIARLRIFIGWTSWDLHIGFGADYHSLAIIIIFTQGRKTKKQNCGIYLT